VFQDKFEVVHLVAADKVVGAMAYEASVGLNAFPAVYKIEGLLGLGFKAGLQKFPPNPGAAHLIFFAKFMAASRTNQRNSRMLGGNMPGYRFEVAEARWIDSNRRAGASQKVGSRSGKNDQRTMPVAALQEFCRAVVHVETVRHIAPEFPNQQCLGKLILQLDRLI
jgi:hypothetical protein